MGRWEAGKGRKAPVDPSEGQESGIWRRQRKQEQGGDIWEGLGEAGTVLGEKCQDPHVCNLGDWGRVRGCQVTTRGAGTGGSFGSC